LQIDSRLRCALFFRDSHLFRAKPVSLTEWDKEFHEKDKRWQMWRYRKEYKKRILEEIRRLRNECSKCCKAD